MKRFAVLGLLLAAVAMMIVACAPPAVQPTPAPEAAEVEKPAEVTPAEAAQAEVAPQAAAAKPLEITLTECVTDTAVQIIEIAPTSSMTLTECLVPRQFILYDTLTCLDTISNTAKLQEYKPVLLKQIVLQGSDKRACPWPLSLGQFKGETEVGMRLYESPHDLGDVIRAVKEEAEKNGCQTIIEPNYQIGNPGTLKGSPWIPVGSPDQGGPVPAPSNSFTTQPAFLDIGLSTPATTGGQGVRVGIFDTAPEAFSVAPGTSCDVTAKVPDVGHELGMRVTGLIPSATVNSQGSDIGDDHGLFVAGLVKAVAPEAKVELYQVLDKNAVGDLFTLMEAIKSFICSGQPDHSVVNLSLGLHWYDEGTWPEQCGAWTTDFAEIWSLQDLLNAAKELGVVVVAAAGNNANNNKNDGGQGPDIPAEWGNTIGVAASVPAGGLACFSNAGDVLAPGGEGLKAPNATDCKPPFQDCTTPSMTQGCGPYGLVSLGTKSTTNYWYWAGTSFAAPLVSGLVARCIQEANDAGADWSGADVPANVWTAINRAAANHSRVIHVGNTLANCK